MVGVRPDDLRISGSRSFVEGGVEVTIDPGRERLQQQQQRRGSYNRNRSHHPDTDHFVDDDKAVVKYLEGVVRLGCTDAAVLNYLISLYATFEDEAPLLAFLTEHVPERVDTAHALRVVLRTGRHFRSAVRLYMAFGLRRQAVELALKVDPASARELARESTEPEERRRLWLMIAKACASGDETGSSAAHHRDVVDKVVDVLRDCGSDVLSIEDVLPFLPDFAQIDQFKDEICSALTSYSSKIDQYLREMDECDRACDALRREAARLRAHETRLSPRARCALTGKLVLNEDEPFYVFPSGYVALEGPLKENVRPRLNDKQRGRLAEVERELSTSRRGRGRARRDDDDDDHDDPKERARLNGLQAELDGLVAAECPLTGSGMVESIDDGFLDSLAEDVKYDGRQRP